MLNLYLHIFGLKLIFNPKNSRFTYYLMIYFEGRMRKILTSKKGKF